MTVASRRSRSGITLTEILISIMIMGIGLTSVLTLFPIGLLRLRSAARDSRSTLAAQTAISEIAARDLFSNRSFRVTWYPGYDPWTRDFTNAADNPVGVKSFPGTPGLPVAYDPLFWSTVHYQTASEPTPQTPATFDTAARFGRGIGFIRPDPSGGDPIAHGLRRVTNFLPAQPDGVDNNSNGTVDEWGERAYPFTYSMPPPYPPGQEVAGDVFSSLDDPVFQQAGATADPTTGVGSPLVPNLSQGQLLRDWNYTFMITAQMVSAGDYSVYEGSLVMYEKRPLGLDPATDLAGNLAAIPTGERVVEAIWAYGPPGPVALYGKYYSTGDDQTVLLRWPAGTPDPTVNVGNWIADVTYERLQNESNTRFGGLYPGQRCHWYQINKKGPIEYDPDVPQPHRRIIIRVSAPVKAKTELVGGTSPPTAVHVNAALLNPNVINVFPKIFYSR